MKLSDLMNGIDVVSENINVGDFGIGIEKISSDTRDISPDTLFVCIKGTKTDSHALIGDIREIAAVAVMDDPAAYENAGMPAILVGNSRKALSRLWSNFCGDPGKRLKIVAVTGTNGKSSTVGILKSVFEYAGYKCASIGTVNMPLTTPDPYMLYPLFHDLAEDGVEYVFMEASSHALYFDKLDPIDFEAGIFTNLTPEHLDFHKDMDAYAQAKAKLFRKCGVSIVNADSAYADRMIAASSGKIRSYSASGGDADYIAESAKVSLSSCVYELLYPNGRSHIRVNRSGVFNIENTLAAAALADTLGLGMSVIAAGIAAYKGAPGRFEEIASNGRFKVFIDYAHTPDALEKLLTGVRRIKHGNSRIVTVFGCGGDRDKTKRAAMGGIASKYSDFSIITSDNSRSENPYKIIADIMEGFDIKKPFVIIADRRQAIEYAIRTARRGDIILLCGKGHEDYEIDETGRHPFSEKEIIKNLVSGIQ